ncbi:patatin-like phospholipase family protein [Pseudooceanicola sp. HF7]|uniref:patatin-like phospholipase family protein n=1 Tax=Pseudooceanicola sp. HF7 TaxID=2721560 RepID=UPI0014315E96|nr:patatin-like phospholipase family protein [Pseudooceanicola sp. HF7]NIZ09890.1 patatin-like phospholipase family protein [Pseudooceanicola sp. HF7]
MAADKSDGSSDAGRDVDPVVDPTPIPGADAKGKPAQDAVLPGAGSKPAKAADAKAVTRINLALQGGGAHGAYTWGVLDRLLEEEDLEIAAMSGTSAGAMNAAALKAGWVKDGRQGARDALDDFWAQMGAVEDSNMLRWMTATFPGAMPWHVSRSMELSYAGTVSDMLSLMTTPYALGAFYRNPLRPIVEKFDFDSVCSSDGPDLFICATKVRDGKIRVFDNAEVTTDVLLASACLPTVFTAVEFYDERSGRKEAFWDGGYSGNPAIFPLFRSDLPNDVLIVSINPLERDELPMLPNEIHNRINEISFNSSLLRELRAIEYVQRLIDEGRVTSHEKKKVLIHMISDDEVMLDLSMVTKMFPNGFLLNSLKQAGRASAEKFLTDHKADLGQRSTLDMVEMFS